MKLRKNFPLRGTYCLKVCRGFSSLATPLLLFLYPAPETVPDYEILTQTKSLTSVKIRKKFSLFSKNQFQKPTKQQFSSIFPAKETFEIFSGLCIMHYGNVENKAYKIGKIKQIKMAKISNFFRLCQSAPKSVECKL